MTRFVENNQIAKNKATFQALEIIQSYPWLVSIYVFVTAIISFVACYWFEEGLKSPRYQGGNRIHLTIQYSLYSIDAF